MKHPKILVIYKRSSLSVAGKLSEQLRYNERFQANHKAHYLTLRHVESILNTHKIKYHKHTRSRGLNYKPYSLVITVGGDGTLLEAARGLTSKQILLGVNSDPKWSIGQFCSCHQGTFEQVLLKTLKEPSVFRLTKLKLDLFSNKEKYSVECLNDILICHANPAAMTRYQLKIGTVTEFHRNSGIWFSTAAGSTGAMLSAGGVRMKPSSTDIQYKPRELYQVQSVSYQLTGGFIPKMKKAQIVSSMARGCIFVDGSHVKLPFSYGSRAEVSSSKNFIQLVHEPKF